MTSTQARSKGVELDRRLLDAACRGRWTDVKALLAKGAHPNTGFVSHHGVAFTPLACAVRAKNIEMVDLLVDAGADLNPTEGDVPSLLLAPLASAIEQEDVKMMRELIARGANVNWKDERGLTLLMVAAGASSRPEIVKTLLDAGADAKARDQEGRTALTFAEQFNDGLRLESVREEIIRLLKQAAVKE